MPILSGWAHRPACYRTFTDLGAIGSAAVTCTFYMHSGNTIGLHHLALFHIPVSAHFC